MMRDDCKTENIDDVNVEKQQEMLLMNKLNASGKPPPKSQSSFLQKKLQQRVSLREVNSQNATNHRILAMISDISLFRNFLILEITL